VARLPHPPDKLLACLDNFRVFILPTEVRELLAIIGDRSRASALRFFLSQQSFSNCPRAKRSRSTTRAGLAGYLFETAHNTIAPIWQPRAYIRSSELGSIVEGAHSNDARKAKGWLEHELRHATETREA
jgi:hypothetical protein